MDDDSLRLVAPVRVLYSPSREEFWGANGVFESQLPSIIRGLRVGKCLEKWDGEYFKKDEIGKTRVSVHVSNDDCLNFIKKKFPV